MKKSTGLLAVAALCGSQASAQDAAEVCAMAERHYAAIRAGDVESVIQHHRPEFTFFVADGGLLWSFHTLEQQRAEMLAGVEFEFRTYIRHCSAQVYGNTGIATYYLVGSVAIGDKSEAGTWRVTEVWVKDGEEWKEAHHHESPLLGSVVP